MRLHEILVVEIDMMHLIFCYVHLMGHRYEKIDGSQASLMHVDARVNETLHYSS